MSEMAGEWLVKYGSVQHVLPEVLVVPLIHMVQHNLPTCLTVPARVCINVCVHVCVCA